jgi:hypothetical protein
VKWFHERRGLAPVSLPPASGRRGAHDRPAHRSLASRIRATFCFALLQGGIILLVACACKAAQSRRRSPPQSDSSNECGQPPLQTVRSFFWIMYVDFVRWLPAADGHRAARAHYRQLQIASSVNFWLHGARFAFNSLNNLMNGLGRLFWRALGHHRTGVMLTITLLAEGITILLRNVRRNQCFSCCSRPRASGGDIYSIFAYFGPVRPKCASKLCSALYGQGCAALFVPFGSLLAPSRQLVCDSDDRGARDAVWPPADVFVVRPFAAT